MTRIIVSDLSGPCGQAIARHFLGKGVAVAGLRGEKLPGDLSGVEVYDYDATHDAGCEAFAAKLEAEKKDFDALVLTGRQLEKSLVSDCPLEVFERTISANTKAAFFLIKRVGGILRAKKQGAVIIVGSTHGEKPTGAAFAFSASMGSMKMMHREASLQLGRDGVHCVLLEMGPTTYDEEIMDTPLSPIYDGFEQSIPRKRACTFEELAGIVQMSIDNPMLNGADIRCDGGFMLKYGDR